VTHSLPSAGTRFAPTWGPPDVEVSGGEVVCSHKELDRAPRIPTAAEHRAAERFPWTRIPDYDRVPSGRLRLTLPQTHGTTVGSGPTARAGSRVLKSGYPADHTGGQVACRSHDNRGFRGYAERCTGSATISNPPSLTIGRRSLPPSRSTARVTSPWKRNGLARSTDLNCPDRASHLEGGVLSAPGHPGFGKMRSVSGPA